MRLTEPQLELLTRIVARHQVACAMAGPDAVQHTATLAGMLVTLQTLMPARAFFRLCRLWDIDVDSAEMLINLGADISPDDGALFPEPTRHHLHD